ncbi:MAG: hypothetical protein ABII82_10085 [Verrucomicrobiota bacterium]
MILQMGAYAHGVGSGEVATCGIDPIDTAGIGTEFRARLVRDLLEERRTELPPVRLEAFD